MKMRIQNYSHKHIQIQAEGGHTTTPGSSVEGSVLDLSTAKTVGHIAPRSSKPNDLLASQVWNNASYKEFLFF